MVVSPSLRTERSPSSWIGRLFTNLSPKEDDSNGSTSSSKPIPLSETVKIYNSPLYSSLTFMFPFPSGNACLMEFEISSLQ